MSAEINSQLDRALGVYLDNDRKKLPSREDIILRLRTFINGAPLLSGPEITSVANDAVKYLKAPDQIKEGIKNDIVKTISSLLTQNSERERKLDIFIGRLQNLFAQISQNHGPTHFGMRLRNVTKDDVKKAVMTIYPESAFLKEVQLNNIIEKAKTWYEKKKKEPTESKLINELRDLVFISAPVLTPPAAPAPAPAAPAPAPAPAPAAPAPAPAPAPAAPAPAPAAPAPAPAAPVNSLSNNSQAEIETKVRDIFSKLKSENSFISSKILRELGNEFPDQLYSISEEELKYLISIIKAQETNPQNDAYLNLVVKFINGISIPVVHPPAAPAPAPAAPAPAPAAPAPAPAPAPAAPAPAAPAPAPAPAAPAPAAPAPAPAPAAPAPAAPAPAPAPAAPAPAAPAPAPAAPAPAPAPAAPAPAAPAPAPAAPAPAAPAPAPAPAPAAPDLSTELKAHLELVLRGLFSKRNLSDSEIIPALQPHIPKIVSLSDSDKNDIVLAVRRWQDRSNTSKGNDVQMIVQRILDRGLVSMPNPHQFKIYRPKAKTAQAPKKPEAGNPPEHNAPGHGAHH